MARAGTAGWEGQGRALSGGAGPRLGAEARDVGLFRRMTRTTTPTTPRGPAAGLSHREKKPQGASARTGGSVGDGRDIAAKLGTGEMAETDPKTVQDLTSVVRDGCTAEAATCGRRPLRGRAGPGSGNRVSRGFAGRAP